MSDTIHVRFTESKTVFRYLWREGRFVSAFPQLHPGPCGWTQERASKGWRRHVRRMKVMQR